MTGAGLQSKGGEDAREEGGGEEDLCCVALSYKMS